MPKIKVLYTFKYGAGWSTWSENHDVGRFMATYKPLVGFVENRYKEISNLNLSERYNSVIVEKNDPIIELLRDDIYWLFKPEHMPYFEGCRNLALMEVETPFCIVEELDGKEKVKSLNHEGILFT